MVKTIDEAEALIRVLVSLEANRSFIRTYERKLRTSELHTFILEHDTQELYGALMDAFSYQGTSDAVVSDFIDRHGNATFAEIEHQLMPPRELCFKLASFEAYRACGFKQTSWRCNNQPFYSRCPVPNLPLRKGQLNQLAFSLYLFIRDRCHGDLVSFIDSCIQEAAHDPDPVVSARKSLLEAFQSIQGIGPKLISMALASLLMSVGRKKPGREKASRVLALSGVSSNRQKAPGWVEVGRTFVVVDSLVHNFFHRTGILAAYGKSHAYGPLCYSDRGCSAILQDLAQKIDLKTVHPKLPSHNPRLVQAVIWRFCNSLGLDICNGNRIKDTEACQQTDCPLGSGCARLPLKPKPKEHAGLGTRDRAGRRARTEGRGGIGGHDRAEKDRMDGTSRRSSRSEQQNPHHPSRPEQPDTTPRHDGAQDPSPASPRLTATRKRPARRKPWRGLVDGLDQPQTTLPRPYQQGNLDGLCGLYATINAIRLAYRPFGRFNQDKIDTVFEALLDLIDTRWGLRQVITTGLEEDQMQVLIHHGLRLASLQTHRRFWKCRKSLQAIERAKDNWLPIVGVLSVFPANALIVGITGRLSHWSVLAEVTRKVFILNDSDALKRLSINRCSWRLSPKGRTTIHHLKICSVIRCR